MGGCESQEAAGVPAAPPKRLVEEQPKRGAKRPGPLPPLKTSVSLKIAALDEVSPRTKPVYTSMKLEKPTVGSVTRSQLFTVPGNGAHMATGLEASIFRELNKIRRNPKGYVRIAQGTHALTPAGSAVAFTGFLHAQRALPPFKGISRGLQLAATERAQGLVARALKPASPEGLADDEEASPLVQRLSSKEIRGVPCAEAVVYDAKTAQQVALHILVDAEAREHLMGRNFSHVGIRCEQYPGCVRVCVIDFGGLREYSASELKEASSEAPLSPLNGEASSEARLSPSIDGDDEPPTQAS